MNMKRFLALALCITALAGCNSSGTVKAPETGNTENAETAENTEEDTAEGESADVQVHWADGSDGEYEEFIADDTEPQVKAVFTTDKAVKDFKVLSLELKDVDEDGNISFTTKELYSMDELTPEKGLIVGLTLYGTIPNYGISYVDTDGETRQFYVTESGKDGSAVMGEF